MRNSARLLSFVFFISFISIAAACASTGGERVSGNTLSGDRLAEGPWNTVYEVLSRHSALEVVREGGSEGFMLATRGGENRSLSGGSRAMLVSIDGVQINSGSGSMLRGIQVDQVETIRILRPSEAGSRYGVQGGNGVIVVETKN